MIKCFHFATSFHLKTMCIEISYTHVSHTPPPTHTEKDRKGEGGRMHTHTHTHTTHTHTLTHKHTRTQTHTQTLAFPSSNVSLEQGCSKFTLTPFSITFVINVSGSVWRPFLNEYTVHCSALAFARREQGSKEESDCVWGVRVWGVRVCVRACVCV